MISDKNEDDSDERPETPPMDDCCGNGCNPCILDVHKKLLEQWKERKKNNTNEVPIKNLISQISFDAFIVSDTYQSSEDFIVIELEYKGIRTKNRCLQIIPGQHIILRAGSVSRPYTPISWSDTTMVLLVKIYPLGQLSQILNNAKKHDEFEIRGPYGDFRYRCNSFQQIIMFCIGSGIAAVYPLAKIIVENEIEVTKINLIAGFRSISRVPIKKELRNISDYWNCRCTLHISEKLVSDCNQSIHGINIESGRIIKQSVYNYLQSSKPETTLILICGTDEFNQSVKQWSLENNYSHIHVFE